MATWNRTLRRLLTVLVLAAVVLSTHEARADDKKRRGTAGAAHLRLPVSARLAALGTTATAGLPTLHGTEALFANPAGLMLNRGTGVLFSRMDYVVDVGINTLGVAQQLGNNNLALFISSWDVGEIPRQTESSPELTDLTFEPRIITLGAAYARQFTDRIAAGVTVKVINEDIDDIDATAVAFDGGVTYATDAVGLRFGFSVKNIGTRLTYGGAGLIRSVQLGEQRPDADDNTLSFDAEGADLPAMLNLGVAYTRDLAASTTVSVLANFRSNSFDQDQYAAGLEVGFLDLDLFYVRGGVELASDQDLTFFKGGNFGAGLEVEVAGLQVAVDYAYRPTDFFADVQVFTLNLTL